MTEDKRGERRSETARQNDDSDMIEEAIDTPDQQGRSGGNLQRDVGTNASKERVRDPEATEGPTKAYEIAHGTNTVGKPRRGDA